MEPRLGTNSANAGQFRPEVGQTWDETGHIWPNSGRNWAPRATPGSLGPLRTPGEATLRQLSCSCMLSAVVGLSNAAGITRLDLHTLASSYPGTTPCGHTLLVDRHSIVPPPWVANLAQVGPNLTRCSINFGRIRPNFGPGCERLRCNFDKTWPGLGQVSAMSISFMCDSGEHRPAFTEFALSWLRIDCGQMSEGRVESQGRTLVRDSEGHRVLQRRKWPTRPNEANPMLRPDSTLPSVTLPPPPLTKLRNNRSGHRRQIRTPRNTPCRSQCFNGGRWATLALRPPMSTRGATLRAGEEMRHDMLHPTTWGKPRHGADSPAATKGHWRLALRNCWLRGLSSQSASREPISTSFGESGKVCREKSASAIHSPARPVDLVQRKRRPGVWSNKWGPADASKRRAGSTRVAAQVVSRFHFSTHAPTHPPKVPNSARCAVWVGGTTHVGRWGHRERSLAAYRNHLKSICDCCPKTSDRDIINSTTAQAAPTNKQNARLKIAADRQRRAVRNNGSVLTRHRRTSSAERNVAPRAPAPPVRSTAARPPRRQGCDAYFCLIGALTSNSAVSARVGLRT